MLQYHVAPHALWNITNSFTYSTTVYEHFSINLNRQVFLQLKVVFYEIERLKKCHMSRQYPHLNNIS